MLTVVEFCTSLIEDTASETALLVTRENVESLVLRNRRLAVLFDKRSDKATHHTSCWT